MTRSRAETFSRNQIVDPPDSGALGLYPTGYIKLLNDDGRGRLIFKAANPKQRWNTTRYSASTHDVHQTAARNAGFTSMDLFRSHLPSRNKTTSSSNQPKLWHLSIAFWFALCIAPFPLSLQWIPLSWVTILPLSLYMMAGHSRKMIGWTRLIGRRSSRTLFGSNYASNRNALLSGA